MGGPDTANATGAAKCLRQHFALLGQDTFCKALGGHQVEQILREEVGPYRERIYPPMVTLRLFIDQILSPDAACQDAVGRPSKNWQLITSHSEQLRLS